MNSLSLRLALGSALLSAAFAFPLMAYAQQADLQMTVRAALAGDPRTAGMSPAQIDAMVSVLTAQAQKQGVTPGDITWRPVIDAPRQEITSSCGDFPAFLCVINRSFGFDDSDYTMPIMLGLSSMLLLFFIAIFLERHYAHMRALQNIPPTQV